ncbi:uncharacterized protein LOC117115955 [Anneissia japonica]|uniref:uncharacterized protein LOC117115955 n=1 Tax=Anneissia japonica TaxID=1529436 RepID=UPI0014257428|nr:uncharacterized protein LOC117115955 [Anneissia japonica]
MKKLNNVTFQRCLSPLDTVGLPMLVNFCDASEEAFGACAYLRWEVEGEPRYSTRFVAARSRVAPLKKLTIPRLELQAAVLAVRLHETIMYEIRLKIQRTIFFTDSTIVYGLEVNQEDSSNSYQQESVRFIAKVVRRSGNMFRES